MERFREDLESIFARYSQNIALDIGSTTLSYAELKDQSTSLARLLAKLLLTKEAFKKDSTKKEFFDNLQADEGIASHPKKDAKEIPKTKEIGSKIGIFAYRETLSYVGMLSCIFLHSCAVPLNPKFPSKRLCAMIRASGIEMMLLGAQCLESFLDIAPFLPPLVIVSDCDLSASIPPPHQFILFDPKCTLRDQNALLEGALECLYSSNPSNLNLPSLNPFELLEFANPNPSLLAYLLFTSGSTGEPKGVLISRENLYAYVRRIIALYDFGPQDVVSQMFDLTFDLAMHDIFVSFLSGARLCVVPQIALFNPASFIVKKQLSVFFAVPSVIMYLERLKALKPGAFGNLRLVLFCGEPLQKRQALAFLRAASGARLVNLYGPTEATIAFMSYELNPTSSTSSTNLASYDGILPLGRPFDGLQASLRDEEAKEVPKGEVGEIWLGGDQIGVGYLNSKLTHEKFLTIANKRWYKTGDLGVIEIIDGVELYCFLGRKDEQVKIQGFRVELLEIDCVLSEAANTRACCVLDFCNQMPILIGVLERGPMTQDEIKTILNTCATKLPAYSIPQRLVALEHFVFNANGKVDRKAIQKRVNNY